MPGVLPLELNCPWLQLCAVAPEIILDKIRLICYNYAIINDGGSQSPPGKVG